jgi:phage baseplate assembly protein W
MAVEVPHLSFPFRIDGDHVGVDEQNDQAEVMSCVNVIARCPLGYRAERPDYGWAWPDFRTAPIDPGGLEIALDRLEPRASTTFYEYADALSAAIRHLQVAVTSESTPTES